MRILREIFNSEEAHADRTLCGIALSILFAAVDKIPQHAPFQRSSTYGSASAARRPQPLATMMGLLEEIAKCQNAGATAATAIMVYTGIDAMAYLSMPAGQTHQTRGDFIGLGEHLPQSLSRHRHRVRWSGRLRSPMRHGPQLFNRRAESGREALAYHDGGQHAYNPEMNAGLVVMGINSMVHDFARAVQSFVQSMMADVNLRERVAGRTPQVVQSVPFNLHGAK